jgi:hypothetical protein
MALCPLSCRNLSVLALPVLLLSAHAGAGGSVPIAGTWNNENRTLSLSANGDCQISESAGGYSGTYVFNAAKKQLTVSVAYSEKPHEKVSRTFTVKKLTADALEISAGVLGQYPDLGGTYWKGQ